MVQKILDLKMNDAPIKLLCRGLHRDQSVMLIKEFESIASELKYFLSKRDDFLATDKELKINGISIILALSVFYRQIIKKIEGGTSFFETLENLDEGINIIKIGSLDFSSDKKQRLGDATSAFTTLVQRFGIPDILLNTATTRDFLNRIIEQYFNEKKQQL